MAEASPDQGWTSTLRGIQLRNSTAESEVEFFARNAIPGLTRSGAGRDIEKKGEEQCLD